MFQTFRQKAAGVGLALGAGLAAIAPAYAEGGVADAVTGTITSSLSDVSTIGIAIIGVVVAVVAFNWVRKVIH